MRPSMIATLLYHRITRLQQIILFIHQTVRKGSDFWEYHSQPGRTKCQMRKSVQMCYFQIVHLAHMDTCF